MRARSPAKLLITMDGKGSKRGWLLVVEDGDLESPRVIVGPEATDNRFRVPHSGIA